MMQSREDIEELLAWPEDSAGGIMSPVVFKVAGKMFDLLDLSEDSRGINLKCDPEIDVELREKHPEVSRGLAF